MYYFREDTEGTRLVAIDLKSLVASIKETEALMLERLGGLFFAVTLSVCGSAE